MPFKKVLLIISLVVICALSALGVFFYGNYRKITIHSPTAKPVDVTQANRTELGALATPQPPQHPNDFHNLEPYGILLLGYGGGTHQGGLLTDSMIAAYVVPAKQKVFLISIPRDMWVQLPTSPTNPIHSKINGAYPAGFSDKQYPDKPVQFTGNAGGGEMVKYVVEQVTGLPMNNFVALDFSGFKKSIDVLNGVDINVERTFEDDQYPIEGKETDPCGKTPEEIQQMQATMSSTLLESQFTCRYEHLHFDQGPVHMDGETALKYVRSRHSQQDGTDFGRSARQRNLLVAVKNRVLTLNFIPKIIPFISSLSNDLRTDLTLDDMRTFLKFQSELSKYQIVNIALTDQNVLMEGHSADHQDVLMPLQGEDKWEPVKAWIKAVMEFSQ